MGACLDLSEQVEPVCLWHGEIGQHDVGRTNVDGPHRLTNRGGANDLRPPRFEHEGHGFATIFLIVDYEHRDTAEAFTLHPGVRVGAQLFGRRAIVVENLALIRIPDYGFIHGSARIEGRPTSVMYFENIHKGLLAVIWAPGSGETKLVRFTGRALYDGLSRSDN